MRWQPPRCRSRCAAVAGRSKLLAQLGVVLDDAVVHDGHAPLQSACGCAFSSLGRPCVAHRVWPMPTQPELGEASKAVRRFMSLPTRRTPRPPRPEHGDSRQSRSRGTPAAQDRREARRWPLEGQHIRRFHTWLDRPPVLGVHIGCGRYAAGNSRRCLMPRTGACRPWKKVVKPVRRRFVLTVACELCRHRHDPGWGRRTIRRILRWILSSSAGIECNASPGASRASSFLGHPSSVCRHRLRYLPRRLRP
jgi:hypothetical protein